MFQSSVNKKIPIWGFVRVEGLEPPRREALDPKSSVSTNFTTPAAVKHYAFLKRRCKYRLKNYSTKQFLAFFEKKYLKLFSGK